LNLGQILLFSFCLFAANVLASERGKPLTEINVQLKWRHQFQFAGYYAAIEQGYYRQAGLKVNLLERKPGPTPIEELILGNVDYAIGGVGALIYRLHDVPLVALSAVYQHSPSVLISRYATLAELKQKKVMLSAGVMNAEIVSMLKKAGISLFDIDVIPSNQSIEGFIKGHHDAYNTYVTNETLLLDAQNVPYHKFSPRDYGIDFYGDILLTTERKIKQDINQVKGFRAATIKGWRYAIEHVEETIELIKAKYDTQNKTRQQLYYEANELIRLIYSDIVPIGYMNEQRWQEIVRVLQQTGDLDVGNIEVKGFLFDTYTNRSPMEVFKDNLELVVVVLVLAIGGFLSFYNYRLKIMVKERTCQLDRAIKQAEHDARTDALTGLANRRSFMEAIHRDLSVANRNNLALSLIYIDIDWFKKINDSFGHDAGDLALKSVADILNKNVRASDTAARIGGEEFVIVCLEKNKDDAMQLAERIRKEVAEQTFVYQGKAFQLTMSAGVSSVTNNESIDQILKQSDKALYKAKEQGRNQVQCI